MGRGPDGACRSRRGLAVVVAASGPADCYRRPNCHSLHAMSERLKVLVADDQPDSLDLLRELLTVYNFELRVARNGL